MALNAAALKKLSSLAGATLITVVHEDAKAKLVLALDEAQRAHLFDAGARAAGVTLLTRRRESLHYKDPLVAVDDFPAFLGDAARVDARAMAWTANGGRYREVVRFGRRVLVAWGGNNARTLQTIGLVFDAEAEATRFFSSFSTALPKGFAATSTWYVEGLGGVSREYWPTAKPGKKQVIKAIGRVLDEGTSWTLDHGGGNFTRDEQEHASLEDALAAFNQRELEWYRAGGRPYEVEWMERLKRRAARTLLEEGERLIERKQLEAVERLLVSAGLKGKVAGEDPWAGLRAVHPAHWLLVGQRVPKKLEHHQAPTKPGKPEVHLYLDREHGCVAIVTVAPNKTWGEVKRVAKEKLEGVWGKTMGKLRVRLG